MPTSPNLSPLFFLLAVAFSIGWNAVASGLARYAGLYGSDVLLKLSLAYYIPSVPVLLSAAVLDEWFDAALGRHRARMFRAVAGFGGCATVLAAFPAPAIQGSLPRLLAAVAALGVFSSAAFGCSYQLAERRGEGATVALTLGLVASAPLVLAIEAVLGMGPCGSWCPAGTAVLYGSAACIAAGGGAAAVVLTRRQHRHSRKQLAAGAGEAQQLAALQQPLLEDAAGQPAARGAATEWPAVPANAGEAALDIAMSTLSSPRLSEQLPTPPALLCVEHYEEELLGGSGATPAAVWPAAVSLFLGVSTSMFLFPFLTQLPPQGQLGGMLPVVLFWVRCFADLAGRLLPRALNVLPGPRTLLALALCRAALLPLVPLYIAGRLPAAVYNDWLLVAFVAAMWLTSGALSVWSFLLAPRLVPAALLRKATGYMSVSFNAACLAGLLLAIPVSSSQ